MGPTRNPIIQEAITPHPSWNLTFRGASSAWRFRALRLRQGLPADSSRSNVCSLGLCEDLPIPRRPSAMSGTSAWVTQPGSSGNTAALISLHFKCIFTDRGFGFGISHRSGY